MNSFYTIFVGDTTSFGLLFEILFRTTFIYLYTIGNVRILDKRALGQLSSFEIIIIIALGTSVGDPMFYTQVPLFQAMMVITTIVLLEKLIAKIIDRSPRLERFIIGQPVLIIKEGKILKDVLDSQSLTKDELFSYLRIKSIRNIGEIEYGYLEPSGNISALLYATPKEGSSTLL